MHVFDFLTLVFIITLMHTPTLKLINAAHYSSSEFSDFLASVIIVICGLTLYINSFISPVYPVRLFSNSAATAEEVVFELSWQFSGLIECDEIKPTRSHTTIQSNKQITLFLLYCLCLLHCNQCSMYDSQTTSYEPVKWSASQKDETNDFESVKLHAQSVRAITIYHLTQWLNVCGF